MSDLSFWSNIWSLIDLVQCNTQTVPFYKTSTVTWPWPSDILGSHRHAVVQEIMVTQVATVKHCILGNLFWCAIIYYISQRSVNWFQNVLQCIYTCIGVFYHTYGFLKFVLHWFYYHYVFQQLLKSFSNVCFFSSFFTLECYFLFSRYALLLFRLHI